MTEQEINKRKNGQAKREGEEGMGNKEWGKKEREARGPGKMVKKG